MLVFAFEPTLTTSILDQLNCNNKYYLKSNKQSIDGLLIKLGELKPQRCVGLGIYSGKDQTNIRIETVCTNAFRQKPNQLEKCKLSNFLYPIHGTKLSQGLGNSWCNLVSYKIMKLVSLGELKLEYSFLHIPIGFNQREAADIVASLLDPYSIK